MPCSSRHFQINFINNIIFASWMAVLLLLSFLRSYPGSHRQCLSPRSMLRRNPLFFAAIAVFVVVSSSHTTHADAKMKRVKCSCTKRNSNNVVIHVNKSAIRETGTYFTTCCNKQHPSMNCTSKSYKPVVKEPTTTLGGSTPILPTLLLLPDAPAQRIGIARPMACTVAI